MNLPNPKDLKRLAEMCRKAGIKTFKGDGIEFTLTDEAPVSNYKKAQAAAVEQGEVETDLPSDEALLLWSVQDPMAEETKKAQ